MYNSWNKLTLNVLASSLNQHEVSTLTTGSTTSLPTDQVQILPSFERCKENKAHTRCLRNLVIFRRRRQRRSHFITGFACGNPVKSFTGHIPDSCYCLFSHRRPKLTIRGIDQIFMIYLRVSSETWLLYVCGVVLHIGPLSARSTRHCMEYTITKDKIAQWNKMPLFLNKIK